MCRAIMPTLEAKISLSAKIKKLLVYKKCKFPLSADNYVLTRVELLLKCISAKSCKFEISFKS